MADAALGVAQWAVGKALDVVAEGMLGAWEATRQFGFNIEALKTELEQVRATLEIAATKKLPGPDTMKLLQNLQDSAHNAKDLLDELDYFRIHDELNGTYEAADQHAKGCVCNLVRDARHTAKAIGKQLASLCAYCFRANAGHHQQGDARQHVSRCAWQRARRRSPGDSSLVPNADQADPEVNGCMPKLGKLLPGSSSQYPHVRGDEDHDNAQETAMPVFNRSDFSRRMEGTVEQLNRVRNDVKDILQTCGPRIAPDIAQHRPTTTPQSAEPKLYGRDRVMKSIIHDITEGQYCDKGLTVLPVVGPGGMGKTTLIQHIYNNQQVQSHFPVRIWICVSLNFNLDKVLEEIKRYTPRVKGEKEHVRLEELIEQRLKCKRFLLVLDDIWQFTHLDDWKKLLLILGKSQEKGSMILVTTRIQEIAQEVKTTDHPKELNSLESEDFRKLFLVFIFDDGQCPRNKLHLLDKIMQKLNGSPLAAKTVGRLLRTDPSIGHWRRVLNSKEWGTDNNGIMPALKLSYDFLPFNLQRCFAYSGLFPEDYNFRSDELISLWIGLDILIPNGQNQTFEYIGLSNLNELVTHGFFREEETEYGLRYVMHDLMHDLALKVSSHDCLSLRLSDVLPMEIQPSIRHLSISMDDLGEYDAVSGEKLKSKLEELKTGFKVEHLQTLLLFGEMDEGFVKIFGDFFGEVNALRVLHLPSMVCPVESMLHNFSGLAVHLRYLCLGTQVEQMHLPLNISKFYHLRILDLKWWDGSCVLPDDMSSLAKLCHFYVPSDDQLHSDICNVGKLKLLEELKVFQVKKNSEGFEPKQLEHSTKLRELGMYNLEKIDTTEEAAQAKLMEKRYLRRLTLVWDSEQSSVQPGVESAVLESLQPHGDLQVLCIRGHRGPSCPTWLGDEFAVEALQSLYLDDVSWEVFPSLGKAWDLRKLKLKHIARPKVFIIEKSFCMLTKLKLIGLGSFEKWVFLAEKGSSIGGDLLPPDAHMFPLLQVLVIRNCPKLLGLPFSNHIVSPDWFPKLQELEVCDCPEFSLVIPISWIESLRRVWMRNVKLLVDFGYSKSSSGSTLNITGVSDLLSLDQVLVFDRETGLVKLTLERCPPLELKHLLMLTSLKTLIVEDSDGLVGPLGGGQSDVEWQLPVEHMKICILNGNSGKELTELLPHLPKLSKLEIENCKNIVSLDWFPKLQELEVCDCPEFLAVIPISWIESLRYVRMRNVKLLVDFRYSKSSNGAQLNITGVSDLLSLDQVLVFDKETGLEELTLKRCPPLELKRLLMLTSLRRLTVVNSVGLVGPLGGGQSDVEWQLPVEHMKICILNGNSGKELTELLPHLPKLSKLEIENCENIKKLVVGDDAQQTTQEASEMGGGEITAATEEEDDGDGVLLFPAHLCDSLQELELSFCPELVLVDPPTLVPGGQGGLQALRSLQRLTIRFGPKFLSASLQFSRHIFPSSLQFLKLEGVEGMGTLEGCGQDLKCQGLWSLLTTGGQLKELVVMDSPRFFADWDPNPRRALEDAEGGEEQQTQLVSSTLQVLRTDDIAGLLAAPVCGFLSSSLTKLQLMGDWCGSQGMERFIKEQEDALQLLSSLQKLVFWRFKDLQQLPAGLRNLTSLKILSVNLCPAISSLPNDALPDSLKKLDVNGCSEELEHYCRRLKGTIPEIKIW